MKMPSFEYQETIVDIGVFTVRYVLCRRFLSKVKQLMILGNVKTYIL